MLQAKAASTIDFLSECTQTTTQQIPKLKSLQAPPKSFSTHSKR